jgi:hypothetical protein
VLLAVPSHHQSFDFLFTKTINASASGGHGFSSLLFWFGLGHGLLQAQYTIGGYDTSAHMSEETRRASRKAARSVWTSVALSGVLGWVLLLALTFTVPNVKGTLAAGAFDVQYIWQHSLGTKLAEFLLFVVVAAQFFCHTDVPGPVHRRPYRTRRASDRCGHGRMALRGAPGSSRPAAGAGRRCPARRSLLGRTENSTPDAGPVNGPPARRPVIWLLSVAMMVRRV